MNSPFAEHVQGSSSKSSNKGIETMLIYGGLAIAAYYILSDKKIGLSGTKSKKRNKKKMKK